MLLFRNCGKIVFKSHIKNNKKKLFFDNESTKNNIFFRMLFSSFNFIFTRNSLLLFLKLFFIDILKK